MSTIIVYCYIRYELCFKTLVSFCRFLPPLWVTVVILRHLFLDLQSLPQSLDLQSLPQSLDLQSLPQSLDLQSLPQSLSQLLKT